MFLPLYIIATVRSEYNSHLNEQEEYRRQYKQRVVNAVLRSPYYCSCIVDATSGLASSYMPHVAMQAKGEPER